MKFLPATLFCGCGIAVGLAIGSWRSVDPPPSTQDRFVPQASAPAPADQSSPTVPLSHPSEALDGAYWKNEAEKYKTWSADVHRLRNEVSRLNAELADLQQKHATALQTVAERAKTPAAPPAKQSPEQNNWLALADAPLPVQQAILREVGNAEFKGVVPHSKDGKSFFGLKGKTENGRSFALNLAEDGAILEKHLQIAADTLPAEVAAALQQTFGDMKIGNATQVTDGDQQFYQLSGKSPDQSMEVSIRPDGSLLGYSAKIRSPKQK